EGQRGLARTLALLARWPELVAAHRARLEVLSGAERVAVLVELAAVLESRADDVDGAVAALGEALELSPGHRGAAFALTRLYERAGRWQEALALLDALHGADADRRARAELKSRAGEIQARRADAEGAAASFRVAVELDPGHAGALEGLGLL